jgi:hypothetical protein
MTPLATSQSSSLSGDGVNRPTRPSSTNVSRLTKARVVALPSKISASERIESDEHSEVRNDWRVSVGRVRRRSDQSLLQDSSGVRMRRERIRGRVERKKEGCERAVGGRGGKSPVFTSFVRR